MAAAPLIGLALVVALASGALESDDAVSGTFFAVVLTAINLLLVVLSWTEDRRKGSDLVLLLLAGTALTFSLAALIVQRSTRTFQDTSLPSLTVAVAIASWILPARDRVRLRDVGTPYGAQRPAGPERGRDDLHGRVAVIEILIRRGLVGRKDIDITEMMEMPLGSWRELDSHGGTCESRHDTQIPEAADHAGQGARLVPTRAGAVVPPVRAIGWFRGDRG